MTYTGHVKNGVIVLDEPGALPNGTRVRVEFVEPDGPRRTIAERLKNVRGKAEGLPPDASSKIDEYLYGDIDQ